jgi:regulation of enolase protein 1 (concanavalin A-like superfamily)
MRYHHSLLVGIIVLAGGAAPVLKDGAAEQLKAAYGTWLDPDKDCKYVLKGDELKIAIPKAEHLLKAAHMVQNPKHNAPRVFREVEGNFTAVVRVTFPVPDRLRKGFDPFCSGGLVAWESDDTYLMLRRCGGDLSGPGPGESIFLSDIKPGRTGWSYHPLGKPAESAFVRLKREGKQVAAGWSRDGKSWKDLKPTVVAWGAKIKVGIMAENTLGEPVEIMFDQYSLTQPKE